MSRLTAGLSKHTLEIFTVRLAELGAEQAKHEAEAEQHQDEIDSLREQIDFHQAHASDLHRERSEIAGLLAERHRLRPRYTVVTDEDGSYVQDAYADMVWPYTTNAEGEVERLESTRLSDPHPFETVEHWLK